jgi:S1-C subfamily serine protease
MSTDDQVDWEIPVEARPRPEDYSFDLERALSAVVFIRSQVPEDAFTAQVLGTERAGNGILISDSGLIVTIGYLVTEAESLWLVANNGQTVQGDVIGYDHETGLGLVQALGRLAVRPMEVGSSADLRLNDQTILAAGGGRRHALASKIAAKREFAGSWEYLLDEAIFTTPVHPNWGGTGLIDRHGRLVGVGSLFIQEAGPDSTDGNMVVPIDVLKSILDPMKKTGHTGRPARPWLGLYAADTDDAIVVAGMASAGPASQGGVMIGDEIVKVAGAPVQDLSDLFRNVWGLGHAGVEIPLTVRREESGAHEIILRSADRADFLRKPRLHA